MNKLFLKHLIAGLVAVLAAYVGTTEPINWVYIGIYTVGYVLWYTGKNYAFPSTSPLGFINVWDLLSGLILALGSALSDLAAQWITTTAIDWMVVWHTVWTTTVAYLVTKFGFGGNTVTLQSGFRYKNAA